MPPGPRPGVPAVKFGAVEQPRISPRGADVAGEPSKDSGWGTKDPRHFLSAALEKREEQEGLQQLEWIFRDQLERHKLAMESMVQEQSRQNMKQTADAFKAFEGILQQSHGNLMGMVENSALRIQRQQQQLEEVLDRFVQKTVLAASEGRRTTQTIPETPEQVTRLTEERFHEMHQKSLAEIQRLFQAHPFWRGHTDRRLGQDHVSKVVGSPTADEREKEQGQPQEQQHEQEEAPAEVIRRSKSTVEAQSFVRGLTTGINGNSGIGVDAHKTMQSRASSIGAVGGMFLSSEQARSGYRQYQATLDLLSALFILLNCVWMGVEAELAIESARHGHSMPDLASYVEIAFVVIFSVELAVRAFIQGEYFYKCPNVRMNLFDGTIVLLQVMDSVFVFYNVSWLRSLRVLRLFNAARIVRGIDYVRQLRLLVSAISGCLPSLFWILVLLTFVLYLVSVFVMQSIRGHIQGAPALDPSLLKYYGSMGNCMLTLFMAITGGAPWETLLQPLADISVFFVVAYVLYVTFTVCGLMSIITAIFVESTKVLVQKDGELYVKDLMSSKDSSVNRIRRLLRDMDAEKDGWLTHDELDDALSHPDFVEQMKAAGMADWEAKGLFQLLDTDAVGRITVDEFLYGIIRLKCKDQSVDLATVMYENKRILTRLLAFMRFAEDHFKNIQNFLGMPPDTTRIDRTIEQYLQEASRQHGTPQTKAFAVMVSGARS